MSDKRRGVDVQESIDGYRTWLESLVGTEQSCMRCKRVGTVGEDMHPGVGRTVPITDNQDAYYPTFVCNDTLGCVGRADASN